RGQHAGLVGGADAVVGARRHLADWNHSDAVVEAERRAALHAAPNRAGEVDEVGHAGRGGRPGPRSLPDQQDLSDEVALDEDGVFGALDARERVVEGDKRGMYACLDPTGMAVRVSDELDRVAQLARVSEVDRLDALDALTIDVIRPDLDLVSYGAEDRELCSEEV